MQSLDAMTFTKDSRSAGPAADVASVVAEFVRHLAAGDTRAAANSWDVPALILGDDSAHGPLSRDRLAEMLANRPATQASTTTASSSGQSELAASPEVSIDRVEWRGQRVAAVEARWPRLRQGGLLHDVEAATFLIRNDESDQPKIRGLVLHSARSKEA